MKTYLVFAGDAFYPDGGWDDFIEQTNDPQKVEQLVKDLSEFHNWVQVVDTDTMEVKRYGENNLTPEKDKYAPFASTITSTE